MKLPASLTARRGIRSLVGFTAALLASQSVQAVTSTWLATPSTANLDFAANFSRSPAATGPGLTSGDTIAFGTSTVTALTNNLANGFLVNGINFNSGASAFTITGPNALAINNAINNNSVNTQTLNTGLILTGTNINVGTVAGGTTMISGVVSQDGSARRLSATGLGTLLMNGSVASTYTGQTSAAGQGTFAIDLSNISGNSNLVNTASQLNLGNGNGSEAATLIIKGAATGVSSQTLAGFTLASGTAGSVVINSNGGNGTHLNLGTTVARNAGSAVTFDVSSAGSTLTGTTLGLTAAAQTVNQGVRGYALVKDGSGTGFAANVGGALVRYTGASALANGGVGLTTTAANNYSLAAGGATTSLATAQTVSSLNIATSGSAGTLDIGAGIFTVSGNGVIASGNSNLTIQNGQLGAANSEVIVHAIGTGGVTISSNISSGTGSFTKAGTNAVTLSGNNTYSGITFVVAGILKAGSSTAFSASSTFRISQAAGAGLDLNGFDMAIGELAAGGPLNDGIALGANTLTVGGKGTEFDSNSPIRGTGGVTKVGAGVMQTLASNTYTGATNINEGTIRARNGVVNTLGINSALTIGSAGTLDLYNTNVSVGSLAGSGTVTNAFAGTVALTTGGNNTGTSFSGVISNGATPGTMITGFTKTGTGAQTLSGANTYTGNTTVNSGTLQLAKTASLYNSDSASWTAAKITVSSGATVAINVGGTGEFTAGNVTTLLTNLDGAVANNGLKAGSSIAFDTTNAAGGTFTIGNTIANTTGTGGGVVGVTKLGSNSLVLSGVNTYTGATTINGGTLALDSTGSINNSSGVSLGNGGTFDVSAKAGAYAVKNLTGSGIVIGSLTVSTQLAIGNSPGTATFDSSLIMGALSTYSYELTGGASAADLGIVSGNLTLTSGAVLDLVQLGVYTANDKFTLFAYTGTLSGVFRDTGNVVLADGSTFTDANGNWTIDYNDTSIGLNGGTTSGASYVTITAIPEPGTVLLGGVGLLCLFRRRR